MKSKVLCMAAAALLSIASGSFAQTSSDPKIGSTDSSNVPNASTVTPSSDSPTQPAGTSGSATTGTSTDSAPTGAASTGSTSATSSSRCAALTGDEKEKCMDDQSAPATARPDSSSK
jgi:hypothetical protein